MGDVREVNGGNGRKHPLFVPGLIPPAYNAQQHKTISDILYTVEEANYWDGTRKHNNWS